MRIIRSDYHVCKKNTLKYNVERLQKWLQVFAIPEYVSEWLLYWFKKWAILEVAATVSLVAGIMVYIFGVDDRRELNIINAFSAIEL